MKKLSIIFFSLILASSAFASDQWKKNLFKIPDDQWAAGSTKEKAQYPGGQYMYIIQPLKEKKLFKKELSDMIFIQSGVLNLNSNKLRIKGFYISRYLTSYLNYNSYLNSIDKYYPDVDAEGSPTSNGNYPAKLSFKNSQNYCQWLAKKTGLPFALPTMEQWLYAATSRGINWDYPTDNGKLEIGKNYPNILPRNSLTIVNLVNGLPVNSIGIHQFFGNGAQWTSTRLTNKSQAQFHVFVREHEDYGVNNIVAGTPYSWAKKYVEENKLLNGYYVNSLNPNLEMKTMGGAAFRCVINTDKPLPKV